MSKHKFRFYLAILLSCLAGGLLILSIQPYGIFKGFFNLLMADKDFKSLRESNAIIFRAFIILAGLGVAAATLLVTGKWHIDGSRLHAEISSLWHFLLPDKDEKRFTATLAGITLWGAAMRLVHINGPVSHDEAYTATVFSPSLWYAITNYHAPNNHVLHTLLVHLSTAVFGFQTWAIRLPAFLAGILIIPAAYYLGKSIYDRYTGLFASILVAWWPVQIAYSTNARGYSLVALLTLAALWLGIVVHRERNLVGWALIVLLSTLGFYTVPVMLFPFGVLFVWLFMENMVAGPGEGYASKGVFIRYWLYAGLSTFGLTLFLYSPIFIYSGTRQFLLNGKLSSFDQTGAVILDNIRGMYFEWIGGIPLPLLLLFGTGILLSLIFHRKLSTMRIPLQLAMVVWIGIVLVVLQPDALIRIWFSFAALFAIWASAGLVGLLKGFHLRRIKNISVATVVITCAGIVLFIAGVQLLVTLPHTWAVKGRDEKVVMFLKDKLGEQDIIVAPSPQDASLWYYAKIYGIPNRYFTKSNSFNRAFIITNPVNGQYRKSVIEQFGLTDVVDLQSLKLVQGFSGLNIYEVMHK
jgi:hypothetical protein